MDMQGIMVRIHCIVVKKVGCIVGRKKYFVPIQIRSAALLATFRLAWQQNKIIIAKDLHVNFHLGPTFPSFHFGQ